jgi:hypothetical protein
MSQVLKFFRVHGLLRADAVFLGWQRTPTGKAFAIYNIIAQNHPLCHSTVSASTLRKLGLKIPPTPDPQSGDSRPFVMADKKDTVPARR